MLISRWCSVEDHCKSAVISRYDQCALTISVEERYTPELVETHVDVKMTQRGFQSFHSSLHTLSLQCMIDRVTDYGSGMPSISFSCTFAADWSSCPYAKMYLQGRRQLYFGAGVNSGAANVRRRKAHETSIAPQGSRRKSVRSVSKILVFLDGPVTSRDSPAEPGARWRVVKQKCETQSREYPVGRNIMGQRAL